MILLLYIDLQFFNYLVLKNTTNPPHNFHQSFLSECLILSLDSPFSFTALCMYASIITVACWLLYSASLKIRQCHSSNLVLIFFFLKIVYSHSFPFSYNFRIILVIFPGHLIGVFMGKMMNASLAGF